MTRSDRSAAPDASRLLQSVRQRNEAGVEKALAAGCSVDGSSELDSRPIIAAAASGKVSMTELLIRKGANVDLGSSMTFGGEFRFYRVVFDVSVLVEGIPPIFCGFVG